jgi:D-glycero-D-manno-heptose 1,7-bisphosphate phosphatase
MLSYLENLGIHVEGVYFCPHLPDAKIKKYRKDCTCRKPKLGMYERAIERFDIDISNSWTIGDKIRDCSICCETDCKGILISHNEEKSIIEKVKRNYVKNVRYAENLLGAAKLIAEQEAEE